MPDFTQLQTTIETKLDDPNGGWAQLGELLVLKDLQDEGDRIEITSCRANAIEAQVTDLPDYRLLLFTTPLYPGWKAYVDESPTTIHRANDVLQAVVVPSGTHTVKFVFDSLTVKVGAAVSGLTVLACAGYLLWQRRPRDGLSTNGQR